MTYLGSSFPFSFIFLFFLILSNSFYFFLFFSIFSNFLLIYFSFIIFHLFSNALGILAYIYSNNSIFKEHVFFGETILIHFKINSLEITVSSRKILKTTSLIKDLLLHNGSLIKILLIILNNDI